jgi:hypothetical protein
VKDEVNVPLMPITLNKLKDIIRKATAKTDQPLLQNVWHEVECLLDVCVATNEAHIKIAYGIKTFCVALYRGVPLIFVWLLLSHQ